MQPLKFTLIAMTSLLVLAGCKSEIKTETTLSQLQANEAKPTAAYFSAEVLSCRDPQTGLTDSQVLQLREQVEFILPGARYLGCRDADFQGLVSFETKVQIGGDPLNCSRDDICLGAKGQRRSIVVGKHIRERFSRITDSVNGWTLSDLNVKVAVTNDLGHKVDLYIPSCFLENERGRWSYHDYAIDWNADATYTFALSDVGVDQAFSDDISTIFHVSQ